MSRLNWIELSGEDWERFAEFQQRSDLLWQVCETHRGKMHEEQIAHLRYIHEELVRILSKYDYLGSTDVPVV